MWRLSQRRKILSDQLMPIADSAPSSATLPARSADTSATLSTGPNSTPINPQGDHSAVQSDPTQPLKSSTGVPAQTTRAGLAPSVPVRSSSNSQLRSGGITPMPEPARGNPTLFSRRGSKGSIQPKGRSGSVASSKHSKKETAVGATAIGPGKPAGGNQSASVEKPKKRSGLLAFLNCCNAPENANTVEASDQAVPARKATALQPKSGRQPTTVGKTNAIAGVSGTMESKEAAGEGIGGPEYSEHKAAAKPKMSNQSSKDQISAEKPIPPGSTTQTPDNRDPTLPTAARDSPLPPLPTSNSVPNPDFGNKQDLSMPKATAAAGDAPQLIEPQESVAAQGTTINDRTPQQETQDSDIVMPDAPPVPLLSGESTKNTQDLSQVQMNLPPPPPRNGQERTVPDTTAVAPNEKMRWLLPPLQPQFRGRKCLVLDLDETLVHSSFKVNPPNRCFHQISHLQILHQADFTIPVEIEGQYHNVYVIKRPGVDQFMKRVGELYEVVVFTASVSKVIANLPVRLPLMVLTFLSLSQYGDPLLDQLDIHRVVHHRLFRESCYNHQGNYVKVRSRLCRLPKPRADAIPGSVSSRP